MEKQVKKWKMLKKMRKNGKGNEENEEKCKKMRKMRNIRGEKGRKKTFWSVQKWKFDREKAEITPGKKQEKWFCPPENFSCYAPAVTTKLCNSCLFVIGTDQAISYQIKGCITIMP